MSNNKYHFSTKSKVKRICVIGIILLVLLVVSLCVYWSFKPQDRQCYMGMRYYTSDVDQYNYVIQNGVTKCSGDEISFTLPIYTYGVKEDKNSVFITGVSANSLEKDAVIALELPRNGKVIDFDNQNNTDEYFNLILKFNRKKGISSLATTLCNLVNFKNCKRELLLEDWELDKLQHVTISNFESYQKSIIQKQVEWLFLVNGKKSVSHIYGDKNIDFVFQDYTEEAKLYSLIHNFVGISSALVNLSDDQPYVHSVSSEMKNLFESINKEYKSGVSSEVNCLDVHKVIGNIEKCGSNCKEVLGDDFTKELYSLCINNNSYEDLLSARIRAIEKYNGVPSYKSKTVKDLAPSELDFDINNYGEVSRDTYYTAGFVSLIDSTRGFSYWVNNVKNIGNKEQIFDDMYAETLELYKGLNENNHKNICEVGNLALDYYEYTNDHKYLDDAVYIRNGAKLVDKTNLLESGQGFSISLRDYISCAEFLQRFSQIYGDADAYARSLNIIVERINKSFEAEGFGGAFLTNGYLSTGDSSSTSSRPRGFYDTLKDGDFVEHLFVTDEQAYILSIISSI